MPHLSKRTVDTLKPGAKDYIVFDDELRGFGLRVLTTGTKTFLIQYRSGGRTRRVKVGRYGALTADQARKRAKDLLGDVARGNNPAEEVAVHRRTPTMNELCDRFMEDHVKQRCKPTTQDGYRKVLNGHIKPAFGAHKVVDIARRDVAELHHRLRNRPYQANRVLTVLSKMFNLAELWGLRADGSNPCRHIKKYREAARERFLSPTEQSRLWSVLEEVELGGSESSSAVNAIRLLMLTGCRRGEIQTLKWEDVSPRYLVLSDSKTGMRKVPITDNVRAVLDRLERLDGNPYVITGKVPGQFLTDLEHPWQRIRARAGLGDVRLHDLRHTYASNAVGNGCTLEQIGKLLGHTQIQTTMRYAHLADDVVWQAANTVAATFPRTKATPGQPPGKVISFPEVAESAHQ